MNMFTDLSSKYSYLMYPPYVDAYEESEVDLGMDQIKMNGIQLAITWAEKLLGRCLLLGKPLPRYGNGFVLLCLHVWSDTPEGFSAQLMLVTQKQPGRHWFQSLSYVIDIFPEEWNVTGK